MSRSSLQCERLQRAFFPERRLLTAHSRTTSTPAPFVTSRARPQGLLARRSQPIGTEALGGTEPKRIHIVATHGADAPSHTRRADRHQPRSVRSQLREHRAGRHRCPRSTRAPHAERLQHRALSIDIEVRCTQASRADDDPLGGIRPQVDAGIVISAQRWSLPLRQG